MRVNSTCAHVNAALKALCIPSCFRSTKKMATMLGDPSVPDEHQPRSSGPPAVPPNTPACAVTPSAAPERLSPNTRVNSRDVFCTGFGRDEPPVAPAVRQGYSPDFAAPHGLGRGGANGRGRGRGNARGRGRGRRGRGAGAGRGGGGMGGGGDRIQPKAMLNGINGCFGASAFLFLCAIEADQHLDPTADRSLHQQHLQYHLVQMCLAYRDPLVAPFGPERLINAANACLPVDSRPEDRFGGGDQACAMEFLARNPGGLLHNIFLEPQFLVTYLQQGPCDQCGQVYQQPLPAPVLDIALPILPATAAPVDLQPLLLGALANPTTLTDLTCGRQCSARLLQCSLVEQPGRVQIVNLGRYNGAVRKISVSLCLCLCATLSCMCLQEQNVVETRVAEPNPGDFGGRRVVAVVTREAQHWVTYIVREQLWYRVDSGGGGSVRQSNPFHDQSARRTLCFLAFR